MNNSRRGPHAEAFSRVGGTHTRSSCWFCSRKSLRSVVHLQEIDVHPEHGRRGIGTHLVKTVCDWATVNGYRNVTLTTFRDVPWNMPFYMRLGFEEVPSSELTPELLFVIEDQVRRGLDPHSRLAMRFVIRS